MSPIPDGTFMNATAFSYTFLCSKCISKEASNGLVISAKPDINILGWAFSDKALSDPATASSSLTYHSAGFGAFGMTMDDAKSADFAKWAALAVAGPGNSTTPGNGGNSTSPGNGGNSTTPVNGGNATAPAIGNATYDYIVAGAGPAGIISAMRLAETGASVLLIERGGPSLASSGNTDTLKWNSSVTMYDVPGYAYYQSDVGSPAYCTDTADMAGCLLGGGSVVNAMMYVKPQKRDFDDKWPAGWKWADVSAAADRVWEKDPGQTFGSMDGKRYNDEAYNVLSKFFAGQGWAETDFIKDPNSKVNVYGHPPWLIANGMRAGTVKSYLPLAQALPGFKMMLNTNVVRAVREGKTVTGVEVQSANGQRIIYNVKAGGSVLLSAGSMSTPRILFNSGIGPVKQLQTVASGTSGVTLPKEADWIDLPVGAEIKDHPIFTVMFNTTTPLHAESKTAFTTPNATTEDLFAKGSGLLAQSGQRLNWWTSVKTSGGQEVFFQGTCNGPSENTIQMKIYATHGSQSVGSLGITPAGATTFIVDPHLTSEVDKEAATTMMDRLIKMTSSSNSTLKIVPPKGVTNFTGADLIKSFKTGSHYVGTAKMGTKGESGVVVDKDTKVYGTSNLFVVDASFHPDLSTGNSQAMVMVAAEAAAARIVALGKAAGNDTAQTPPEATNSPPQPSAPAATPTPTPIQSASPVESSPLSTPVESPISNPPAEASPIPTPAPAPPASGTAKNWDRCGGIGYAGPTECAQNWACKKQNDYYSQCLPASFKPRRSQLVKPRASRRLRTPVAPDAVESEVDIAMREKRMRASYLDNYDF